MMIVAGHSGPGAVPHHHHRLLPGSHGLHPDVWRYQRGVFQQCARLVRGDTGIGRYSVLVLSVPLLVMRSGQLIAVDYPQLTIKNSLTLQNSWWWSQGNLHLSVDWEMCTFLEHRVKGKQDVMVGAGRRGGVRKRNNVSPLHAPCHFTGFNWYLQKKWGTRLTYWKRHIYGISACARIWKREKDENRTFHNWCVAYTSFEIIGDCVIRDFVIEK